MERLGESNVNNDEIIRVVNLKKWFPVRTGFLSSLFSKKQLYVRAVNGVNISIRKGEIFGLVGESGCGKTTTGKLLVRLLEPTEGKILFRDEDISHYEGKKLLRFRKNAQMIFQDPYESLNPRLSVYDTIVEPLRLQKIVNGYEEERERAFEMLEVVHLTPPEEFSERYAHELSGGQRQRVAIARALVVNPEFIVADEPVSMLDVSLRASILNLLLEIREKFGVAMLFITHDLAVESYMADRVAIMYLGKIVESGSTQKVLNNPIHPYTQALIAAIPSPNPLQQRRKEFLPGEPPSPINLPPGCVFHPRCPFSSERCKREEPFLEEVEPDHYVACFLLHS